MINYRIDPRGKTHAEVKAKEEEVDRQWRELNERAQRDKQLGRKLSHEEHQDLARSKTAECHDPYYKNQHKNT